ncbi:hypothetical protein Tco_0500933, partial [Tanacetum coccineum]
MRTTEEKVDMSKALDASLVNTESSGSESGKQDTSSSSRNDADADNADIKPVYNKEPMVEVQLTAKCNVFATGQQHSEQPKFNNEGEVPSHKTTKRYKPVEQITMANIPERQIPTGHSLTQASTLGYSEPTNGSNEDITNQYECEQTLDVSTGTLSLSAEFRSDEQAMNSDHNSLELVNQDHNSKQSSSKLVPNVVPPADKTATSQQVLELLFRLRRAALRSHQNESLAIVGRNLFDDDASSSNNTGPKPPTPSKTLHEHSHLTSFGSYEADECKQLSQAEQGNSKRKERGEGGPEWIVRSKLEDELANFMLEKKSQAKRIGDMLIKHLKELREQYS